MLPYMYNPFIHYNLQTLMLANYQVQKVDQACQCPEVPTIDQPTQEDQIVTEIAELLKYLSKNISLMKEQQFDQFARENLQVSYLKFTLQKKQTLLNFNKEMNIPNIIKKRYIQVNKTKEEMTKFIIRRCFLFIKSKISYQDQEGIPAEERDRLFYQSFFSSDVEFLQKLTEVGQTIDDLIPFRRDSKMKTMNDIYLKRLFQSKKFSQYYMSFLESFKEICIAENDDKIDNMTKQMIKIIHTRDFGVFYINKNNFFYQNQKIKSYRRFPWKDHEIIKCEERAQELFTKYHQNRKNERKLFVKSLEKTEVTDKSSESCSLEKQ